MRHDRALAFYDALCTVFREEAQAHGIDSIVAANAMFSCHSTDEYTTVEDLKKTALLVARLITDEI